MHSAPAVTYPVGRCHIRGWLMHGLWGLGGLVCGLWLLAVGRLGALQGLALLVWGGVGLFAWRSLRLAPQGTLRWDGQQWRWLGPDGGSDGVVHARLDFQQLLLLEFQPVTGQVLWLWLDRTMAPNRWIALRRAVFSRAATVHGTDRAADGLIRADAERA